MQSIYRCFNSVSVFRSDVCQQQACEIMAELVEGLQSVFALGHHRNAAIPAFFTPTLRNIIISLSRLPLVNSYTRVPPLVSVCLSVCLSVPLYPPLVSVCPSVSNVCGPTSTRCCS